MDTRWLRISVLTRTGSRHLWRRTAVYLHLSIYLYLCNNKPYSPAKRKKQ